MTSRFTIYSNASIAYFVLHTYHVDDFSGGVDDFSGGSSLLSLGPKRRQHFIFHEQIKISELEY